MRKGVKRRGLLCWDGTEQQFNNRDDGSGSEGGRGLSVCGGGVYFMQRMRDKYKHFLELEFFYGARLGWRVEGRYTHSHGHTHRYVWIPHRASSRQYPEKKRKDTVNASNGFF